MLCKRDPFEDFPQVNQWKKGIGNLGPKANSPYPGPMLDPERCKLQRMTQFYQPMEIPQYSLALQGPAFTWCAVNKLGIDFLVH